MTTPYAVAPAWPPEPEAGCEDATTRLTWYASQARWAPSKHNSQPWRLIVTARDLEVWADPSRLLVETDAPYLAPVPHRGKRNEPAFVVETARRVAVLRGEPFETVAAATAANWLRLCIGEGNG